MDTHAVDSCVRGFQVYSDRWTPALGEILVCEIEDGNASDSYAVSIKKGSEIIGHVPRKISAACHLFLGFGGSLSCIITDAHRRYSSDLPQGGLEIPCKLVFESTMSSNLVPKVRRLVSTCPPIELKLAKKAPKRSIKETVPGIPPDKKIRVDDDVIDLDSISTNDNHQEGVPWLKCERQLLKTTDKDMILKGSVLKHSGIEILNLAVRNILVMY